MTRIDHLVWAAPNLERAIDELQAFLQRVLAPKGRS